MKAKTKNKWKKLKKENGNILSAIIIAGLIGLYFNYINASIHVWGTVIGIWILMILFELIDLKKQNKK